MYIAYYRNLYFSFYSPYGICVINVFNRDSYDLTTGIFETLYLRYTSIYITRFALGHRLDGYGGITAYLYISNLYFPHHFSIYHSYFLKSPIVFSTIPNF